MSAAQATMAVDDERVRVTTWTFRRDGDATEWHVHDYDYMVVPVTGGTFAVTARTEYDVVTVGGAPAVFVEIEYKR
jgi:beta-alanine degradation protein BauB